MSALVALLVVGASSLAFRLVPLLGARRIPDQVSRVAGWAGVSVLTAITVRGVLRHQDHGTPLAPLVAAVAVVVGLVVRWRGRSILVALGAGAGTYLAFGAALAALT